MRKLHESLLLCSSVFHGVLVVQGMLQANHCSLCSKLLLLPFHKFVLKNSAPHGQHSHLTL